MDVSDVSDVTRVVVYGLQVPYHSIIRFSNTYLEWDILSRTYVHVNVSLFYSLLVVLVVLDSCQHLCCCIVQPRQETALMKIYNLFVNTKKTVAVRLFLQALGSDECSVVSKNLCCEVCQPVCPYSALGFTFTPIAQETRKRRSRTHPVPADIQSSLLLAERDAKKNSIAN